jgi:hypothetical protein
MEQARSAVSDVCSWRNRSDALGEFAAFVGKTQSGRHIKPLHWYVACRLVLEGGFNPQEITPRPPFVLTKKGQQLLVRYEPDVANGREECVLGGLKTKNVDVVISKPGIGPVLAISCKGMTGALRNLTNRLEETVGESANLHITYPSLVLGYIFIVRANRSEAQEASDVSSDSNGGLKQNDIAIGDDDAPVASLVRFNYALNEMTGRLGVRDDLSRYESVALGVIDRNGELLNYPSSDSKIHFDRFFSHLYLRYEERFILSAPALRARTERLFWSPASPAFQENALPTKPDYRVHLHYESD